MKALAIVLLVPIWSAVALGAANQVCDMSSGYKPVAGFQVRQSDRALEITWPGERGEQLQAQFTIRDGRPLVQRLAARHKGGRWIVLGNDLTPDFQVTAGKRRISLTQRRLLKQLGIDTPAQEAARKWNTFWDAPLVIPGGHDTTDLPREPEEIQRASVTYHSDHCTVATDGARVSVSFNGLSLGLFSGDLQFTAYKGSNLLRQEAIAKTEQPSVAYIYKAGLRGFTIADDTKLVWRDTARQWQQYEFGGAPNTDPINLRARNRLEILDAGSGSLAIFPPPHKFFFARENEINLGYVYYRKDSANSFSLGVMQPERGEGYVPWGVTDAIWKKRTKTSETEWDNFALYNAPPGTLQHMAVYYYLSPERGHATQRAVLAYTHNDVFKPVPGFKVISGHFHLDFNADAARPRHVGLPASLGFGVSWPGNQYCLPRRLS